MQVKDAYDCIWERLQKIYEGTQPKCLGTVIKFADGGSNPLDTVAIYPAHSPPHWHWVTFGFERLQSIDWEGEGELSCELSFRLSRNPNEKEAPEWGYALLNKLSKYVMNTGCGFDHEHYISWGGSLDGESSKMQALIFQDDQSLGSVDVPGGRVKFLTPIGITLEELEYADKQGPGKFLERFRATDPLGITQLKRKSVV